MGMFNYVYCDAKIKSRDYSGIEFQTKDLEPNVMEKYKITKKGLLLHQRVRYSPTPKRKLPYYKEWKKKKNDPNSSLLLLLGSVTMKPLGWEKINFHGVFNFYNEAYSFMAKFTDGKLKSIRRVGK